jgi:phosphate-selective porin
VSFRAGYAGTGHVTFLPWYEEIDDYTLKLLHLGGSVSYRTPGDDPVRFAAPPSVRMRQQGVARVPNFVDTGDILDVSHTWLYGLESAWVHGPFSGRPN